MEHVDMSNSDAVKPPWATPRFVVFMVIMVVVGVLGLVATVRIGIAGYRQGLTEARMTEIAMEVMAWESEHGTRCRDLTELHGVAISEDLFGDARRRVQPSDDLPVGAYRLGDFIFAPPVWSDDPERSQVLAWTDDVEGYRVMVLRDGRTRSLSPRDWEKLENAGIMGDGSD